MAKVMKMKQQRLHNKVKMMKITARVTITVIMMMTMTEITTMMTAVVALVIEEVQISDILCTTKSGRTERTWKGRYLYY